MGEQVKSLCWKLVNTPSRMSLLKAQRTNEIRAKSKSEVLGAESQSGIETRSDLTWEEKPAEISRMQLAGVKGCFVKIK